MKRRAEGYSTVQKKKQKGFRGTELTQKKLDFGPSTTMMQHTRSKRYAKYQKFRLKKMLYPATAIVEDRFQGLTNYDTNSGYTRISQFSQSGTTITHLPIKIIDLTSFQSGGTLPVVMRNIGWADRTTTSNLYHFDNIGQGPTGAASTGLTSWTVTDAATSSIAATPRVFLKWVKLSFNFYGARNRTTYFNVKLVRFPQLNQNFFVNTSTAESKELVQYLERPLIFNNLQTGDTEVSKKMIVLKSYSWTVQPMTNDSLNTTTGNIKEAHIFFRMNKALNLHWPDEGTHEPHAVPPTAEDNDGIDYEQRIATHKTGPAYGSRVYAIISAFSPVATTLPAGGANAWDTPSEAFARAGTGGNAIAAANEPSFDYLIRRGYLVEPN